MLASLLVTGVAFAGAGFVRTATAGDVAGRTPLPTIEPATIGEQCVADPAFMRRYHMDLLKHQRDDTVFRGIRSAGPPQAAGAASGGRPEAPGGSTSAGAKHSLKECIACHASSKTGSVAKTETNFCVSCHSYTAVKIDCFECHTAKPAALAQRGSK
jgi:hypothetical protein